MNEDRTVAEHHQGYDFGAVDDKALLQQQCMGDFTTHCAGLPPEDGPETQACFEKNMAKLSPGCQNAIQSYKQGRKG